MTFTDTATGSSCDSCQTSTGKSWRSKAQHICPRTYTLPTPRTCGHCGERLVRRDGESRNDFHDRPYCNRACAAAGRAMKERVR